MKIIVNRIRDLAVFALTFSITFVLACGLIKYAVSGELGDGLHSRENQVIGLQNRVYTMENRVKDLESGDYARRIAFITGGDPEAALALDVELSGRVHESRADLEKAKRELAALTGAEE